MVLVVVMMMMMITITIIIRRRRNISLNSNPMLQSVLPVLSSLVSCDGNLLCISRFPRVHISVHLALPNFILYYVASALLFYFSVYLLRYKSCLQCARAFL